MNLYKLSQDENNDWDTFDSCVVCAKNEDDAKTIHPYNKEFIEKERWNSWASTKDKVKCELIGVAEDGIKRGVIVSSFNAG